MSDDRHEAVVAIKDAFKVMQGAVSGFVARCERELDLSGPHLAAMEAVWAGATKVGDVAAMARTHVSSASRAVDHLVDEGLLNRDQDPSDRRAVILTLTDAGDARMARFSELQVDLMQDALRDLGDADVQQLASTMTAFGHGVARSIAGQDVDA